MQRVDKTSIARRVELLRTVLTEGLPAVPAAEGAEEATHRTRLGRRLSRVNFT